ncbi:MAG: hypothetical protein K8I29_16435 [Alphaproteobacteria bacterium]|uniref:Uncharacterized protein n=1 Tax=Candidatus Nitrobium versatile TaxID=2884831 RepID=A0A953SHA7_9BACT|nr:hypothetical protein [Candidatus Nitrobium versatile]
MFAVHNINSYCDFLFNQLNDVKQKLDTAVEKVGDLSSEEREMLSKDNFISDLKSFSDEVGSKLERIGKVCPRAEYGRSTEIHPEAAPYAETPL